MALNDLETASLTTSMVTIYCGIFYLSDMSGIDFENNASLRAIDNGCKYILNFHTNSNNNL